MYVGGDGHTGCVTRLELHGRRIIVKHVETRGFCEVRPRSVAAVFTHFTVHNIAREGKEIGFNPVFERMAERTLRFPQPEYRRQGTDHE